MHVLVGYMLTPNPTRWACTWFIMCHVTRHHPTPTGPVGPLLPHPFYNGSLLPLYCSFYCSFYCHSTGILLLAVLEARDHHQCICKNENSNNLRRLCLRLLLLCNFKLCLFLDINSTHETIEVNTD